jgi:hypothetical protein
MKQLLFICFSILITNCLSAQMCPGGGIDFNNAVTFDPAWIYGCNTGTSCNGGVNFDNRISCQPTTAMDACAPAPSCGNISHDASNVWFKFYASASNVVISCFQNTSLVIGVQVFNGGPFCGSLIEIGCALSGGPSSGVAVNLSGLIPGHLYYFRIFGSATPVSQRTGLYCFCGTTGLSNFILPFAPTDFTGTASDNNILLSWNSSPENNTIAFDMEHSTDGIHFSSIASVTTVLTSAGSHHYSYTDAYPVAGINYYRMKQITADGNFAYSPIISLKVNSVTNFSLFSSLHKKELLVTVLKNDLLTIYNATGQLVQTIAVKPGSHTISTAAMAKGVYLLHSKEYNIVKRFYAL